MPEIETIPSVSFARLHSPLARQIERQLGIKSELFSDPLLTLREFRAAIGSPSYSHVLRLIAEKQIRVWRPNPRGHMKIRLSEVRRYLASGDQQPGVQS